MRRTVPGAKVLANPYGPVESRKNSMGPCFSFSITRAGFITGWFCLRTWGRGKCRGLTCMFRYVCLSGHTSLDVLDPLA